MNSPPHNGRRRTGSRLMMWRKDIQLIGMADLQLEALDFQQPMMNSLHSIGIYGLIYHLHHHYEITIL